MRINFSHWSRSKKYQHHVSVSSSGGTRQEIEKSEEKIFKTIFHFVLTVQFHLHYMYSTLYSTYKLHLLAAANCLPSCLPKQECHVDSVVAWLLVFFRLFLSIGFANSVLYILCISMKVTWQLLLTIQLNILIKISILLLVWFGLLLLLLFE